MTAKRRSLADALGRPNDNPTPPPVAATTPTAESATAAAHAPHRSVPKWAQLERKETRLSLEQISALDALARRLNRGRGGRGERITSNTLIRVGVELLLEHQNQLEGITEDQLVESVRGRLTTHADAR